MFQTNKTVIFCLGLFIMVGGLGYYLTESSKNNQKRIASSITISPPKNAVDEAQPFLQQFFEAIQSTDETSIEKLTTKSYFTRLKNFGSWDKYGEVWPQEYSILKREKGGTSYDVSFIVEGTPQGSNEIVETKFILFVNGNEWKVYEGGQAWNSAYMKGVYESISTTDTPPTGMVLRALPVLLRFFEAVNWADEETIKELTTERYFKLLNGFGSWDSYGEIWPQVFNISEVKETRDSVYFTLEGTHPVSDEKVKDNFMVNRNGDEWRVSNGGKAWISTFLKEVL